MSVISCIKQVGRGAEGYNQHILNSMALAQQASLDLIEQGFIVLSVRIMHQKPVIQIQPCWRCHLLDGIFYKQGHDNRGRFRSYASLKYAGCQVEWTERGDRQLFNKRGHHHGNTGRH